jgi:putative ABC transport system permease protein
MSGNTKNCGGFFLKLIKYIVSFCVLFIGMLIIGESHIFRLNNFYTEFDNTTLYLQTDTTDKEMVNDIVDSAARNEVEVFAFIRSPRSKFLTEFDLYGTTGVEEYINENLNIFEEEYRSLFLGDIQFTFNDMKYVPGIEKIHDFYLIGSKEQVHQFKMDLIDKYAGNHPKEGYVSKESRNTIVSIWLLVISIILFLSFYDVVFQKKENLIRVSMGERIGKIIWKNILLDSFVVTLLFTLVLYILSKYTYVYFEFCISLLLFVILLFLNALLYLNLYFYNLKEVFSNVRGSKKLLSLNYSLKLVTAIITIFIISSNVALIFESFSLYKQKSFFEDHADYYYTRLEHRLIVNNDGSFTDRIKESTIAQAAFYREFFETFEATLLANASGILNGKGILANKNAFDYLLREIKELRGLNLTKDIYFIIPEKMTDDAMIIDQMREAIRFYEGDNFTYNYDVVYYDDIVNIISIDENYINGSEFVKNPVIIYNNMSADVLQSQINDDSHKITFLHDIMYKITDDEFNRFIEEHDLTDQIVIKTNVLENYKNHWRNAKRTLYINLIFSMLVLCLEFIIISSLIKLDYEVNAIELSIKKVMGHSMLEKNSKIIIMTVITAIFSILSTVTVAIIIRLDEVFYLAIGGIVILVLEVSVILFYVRKIENAKIQKILKGGNI